MASRKASLPAVQEEVVRHKMQAVEAFVHRLLESPARRHIAKVLLYGSLARGEATPESDIDLLVVGTGSVPDIKEACLEAAFETMLALGEDLEPLVRTLSQWREPSSWLMHRACSEGKEVYSMEARELKRKEMEALYELASLYLEATNKLLSSGGEGEGSLRLAIDGGYNVIELCAKAFLLSKLDVLPKSHGGVKALFSDHFIKSGLLPRDFGRKLSRCLEYRHEARYDPAAEVTRDKAQMVAAFAAEMVESLEKYLAGLTL